MCEKVLCFIQGHRQLSEIVYTKIFADVRVKPWGSGGDLHLRIYLPFSWSFFLHQKTFQVGLKKKVFLCKMLHKHARTPANIKKKINKGNLLSEHSASFSAASYDEWTRKRIRHVQDMGQPENSLKRKNCVGLHVLKHMYIFHYF